MPWTRKYYTNKSIVIIWQVSTIPRSFAKSFNVYVTIYIWCIVWIKRWLKPLVEYWWQLLCIWEEHLINKYCCGIIVIFPNSIAIWLNNMSGMIHVIFALMLVVYRTFNILLIVSIWSELLSGTQVCLCINVAVSQF